MKLNAYGNLLIRAIQCCIPRSITFAFFGMASAEPTAVIMLLSIMITGIVEHFTFFDINQLRRFDYRNT